MTINFNRTPPSAIALDMKVEARAEVIKERHSLPHALAIAIAVHAEGTSINVVGCEKTEARMAIGIYEAVWRGVASGFHRPEINDAAIYAIKDAIEKGQLEAIRLMTNPEHLKQTVDDIRQIQAEEEAREALARASKQGKI